MLRQDNVTLTRLSAQEALKENVTQSGMQEELPWEKLTELSFER
jgi:hypothetical protein